MITTNFAPTLQHATALGLPRQQSVSRHSVSRHWASQNAASQNAASQNAASQNWASQGRDSAPRSATPNILEKAVRRGRLEWGTIAAPLTGDHVLALFETLRHPLLDQHALMIRLTAEPGCLGSLADALERADQRHGVEIDLVIGDPDEADVAGREARDLSARGLFVRWRLGENVGQSQSEAHVIRHLVEHALVHGVADVVSAGAASNPSDREIGRLRLAYALPREPAGRG